MMKEYERCRELTEILTSSDTDIGMLLALDIVINGESDGAE